jgi:uncharacterized protein
MTTTTLLHRGFSTGWVAVMLILIMTISHNADAQSTGKSHRDSLQSLPANEIIIKGYLGNKINECISQRIMNQDFQALVDPFKNRNESNLWQTEFWGKSILAAINAWSYNQDTELLKTIVKAANGLMATQSADGYIGNYSAEARLTNWDIWGMKYTLLGLLSYYDITGDKKALASARRLADYLLSVVGPGKVNIVKTGNYRGMPSSSVLEPMVLLYNHTGDKRYLDFAEYIVEQWETADGPGLIHKALDGIDVAERFPIPAVWWGYENGQKAYEMMSCYEGLLELYRINPRPEYLKAVEIVVSNIINTEINAAGSGTAFECFYHGNELQTRPAYHTMETCVTFTWIKLCNNLLRLTGNPLYADQIEKSVYNALLASMKQDASMIAKYSPLEGTRQAGEKQCGMDINCCSANGPRAFTMIPTIAWQYSQERICINLYGSSTALFRLDPKNNVKIEQNSGYPYSDSVLITIVPDAPATFTLSLRIPAWSENSEVIVNGTKVDGAVPGSYCSIRRKWQAGDRIQLILDMRGRMVILNGHQAILRGPVLLARDSRFKDGDVDETGVVVHRDQFVELQASENKTGNIWMCFTAPVILGTDLEGEYALPRTIHFCDFSSAGNTWEHNSRYKVWIPQTLDVKLQQE